MAQYHRFLLLLGRVAVLPSQHVDSYVVLDSGSFLPREWLDIHEWFKGGKAPEEWLGRFYATAPNSFGDIDRENERNSRVL